MACYHAPREWEDWSKWLAAGLHGRSQWRLAPLLMGLLFAGGRRVVASWIRTAGLSDDYRDFYFFLQSVGQRWPELGRRVLMLVLRRALKDQQRVLVAIDDSPTKRYGPKVQGAGIHHDPTPGPTGRPFCYGHVWVTLAVIVRHPLWGTIGLPIWSWLYVRRQDVPKIPKRHHWVFQTKLQQAADLVLMAAETLQYAGKQVWAVVDGAYAKRPFVRAGHRRDVRRSRGHRASLPRREGSLGQRPTTGAQPVDEHRRVAPQSLDAHPGGTLGLATQSHHAHPSRRLSMGHSRSASVSRRSPQSLAGGLLERRIFTPCPPRTTPPKIPHAAETPAPNRRVTK